MIFLLKYMVLIEVCLNRVSIVEFIVGNTVEFVNVTMNMTMNPTNSNKASENRKKKKVLAPTEN